MAIGRKTGGRDFQKGQAPGPGRPKESEETKLKRRALRECMEEYLESGEASEDFERLRKKNPGHALEMAQDRVIGKPTQPISGPGGGPINIKVVYADERDRPKS